MHLTMDEINKRFADEWVVIGSPTFDAHGHVTEGDVLLHDPDRMVIDRAASEDWPTELAVLFTGSVPDDKVVVL